MMVDKKRIKTLVSEHNKANAELAKVRAHKHELFVELQGLIAEADAEHLSVTIDGDVIGGLDAPGGISITATAKSVGE
jgi:uncharacterized coiled-coil DUF342 family protein